jgi:hypothetical protein
MDKKSLYGLRIDRFQVNDSGDVLLQVVADVEYSIKDYGGLQVIRSGGHYSEHSLKGKYDKILVEFECNQLKAILELFGIDVSGFDEMSKNLEVYKF